VRYLGMEVDKAIEVAERIDIWVADAIPSAVDMGSCRWFRRRCGSGQRLPVDSRVQGPRLGV